MLAALPEGGDPPRMFEPALFPSARELTGLRALVTGSTSGIGLAIARSLAKQGAKVMLNGFGDPALIENLKKELRAEHSPADMTKPAEIEALVKETAARLGSLDILVNNAGIQHVAPIDQFPAERWDAVIAINLSSSFHTIKHALPLMKKAGWGRIINIASSHGLVASVEKAAYVAAKHGLVGLTKVVALETARTSITCNAICPGWVLTPLVQKQIDARAAGGRMTPEEAKNALLGEKTPSLEFVTPEQIGELALFLCSDAAAQIRGASYSIDGGWTAQ
jgi:3-hydroxybutyrate dehydrogenase